MATPRHLERMPLMRLQTFYTEAIMNGSMFLEIAKCVHLQLSRDEVFMYTVLVLPEPSVVDLRIHY